MPDSRNVFDDGSIEVLLWAGNLALLKASGMKFEITVPDLIARHPRGPFDLLASGS